MGTSQEARRQDIVRDWLLLSAMGSHRQRAVSKLEAPSHSLATMEARAI